MLSWGLDLAKRPYSVVGESFTKGLLYVGLVVLLGVLYFVQQRMVASRATVSPTMSATQAKILQYLPVVFGIFQIFFPVGLVIYYISQTIVRIAQQAYVTRRFYRGEHSLGRQAQAASAKAREMAEKDGSGTGLFSQLRNEANQAKQAKDKPTPGGSKRVTPPKGGSTGSKGRPTPSNPPKPTGKNRHPKPPRRP